MLTFLMLWIVAVVLAYGMFRFGLVIGYQRALRDLRSMPGQVGDVPPPGGVRV